jgi:hypothetical protein
MGVALAFALPFAVYCQDPPYTIPVLPPPPPVTLVPVAPYQPVSNFAPGLHIGKGHIPLPPPPMAGNTYAPSRKAMDEQYREIENDYPPVPPPTNPTPVIWFLVVINGMALSLLGMCAGFFWLCMLVDCLRLPQTAKDKLGWAAAILVFNVPGAMSYFFLRRTVRIEAN